MPDSQQDAPSEAACFAIILAGNVGMACGLASPATRVSANTRTPETIEERDMKGELRCIDGRIFRHDPQSDDPDFETDIGTCPDCSGDGCGDNPNEAVSKPGRSQEWLRDPDWELQKRRDQG